MADLREQADMDEPMPEEWRPVVGAEGYYEVSDLGRVRRLRILSPTVSSRDGYLQISLKALPSGAKTRRVHTLVAEAFIGRRPDGQQVRHLDGDSRNNVLANLQFGTPSENSLDKQRHGRDPNASKTHCHRGHEFTAENTYVDKKGSRRCRKCGVIRRREIADKYPGREAALARARRAKRKAA